MSSMLWPEISFIVKEIDREISGFPIKAPTLEAIDNLHAALSRYLNQLRFSLDSSLGEMQTSLRQTPTALILSPLAAMFDEEIKPMILANAPILNWPTVSTEFFGDYNAGDRFYQYLDEILDDPAMPQVVFEVFLFVLKRGFRGKHDKSRLQIGKYIDLLIERIPKGDDIATQQQAVLRRPLNEPHFGKKQYYLMGIGAVALVWCSLYFISNQV